MSVEQRPNHDNISHNHAVALALAAKGVKVFPCRWDDGPPDSDGHPKWRAKSPMPRIKWTIKATTEPEIINAWWEQAPLALVGMPLAPLDYVVLDPDQHVGGPDGVASFNELARKHPQLLGGRVIITPQGRHYVYKQPSNMRLGNAEGNLPPGINVRGDGGYVIAPGTTLPDGRGWVLHDDAEPFTIPQAIASMISGANEDSSEYTLIDRLTFPDDPREAAYLKAACRNAFAKTSEARVGTRNNTLNTQALKLGHFVPHLLNENEMRAMLTAAATHAGLEPAAIAATFRSGMDAGKAEPRQIPDAVDVVDEFWEHDESEPHQAPADPVYADPDLWDIPKTEFLVDGMIPRNTLGLMVGESQTFKSFMAQSIALAIAARLPDWQGHAIAAPPGATVLYIAGEGGIESAALRMRAWATQHGFTRETLGGRFHLIPWQINLLSKTSFGRLVAACKAKVKGQLALIVIDTINTASAGADENSAQDMGTLYAVMRKLSTIFTTAIMGVHHTNKRGGTRGSNLLTQNADFWLHMVRPQRAWLTMNVELHVAKLKDAPSGAIEHYHLDLVAMSDATSLVPKRIGAIQAERTETTAMGRPSSRQEAILEVLRRSRNIEGETRSEICAIMDITEMKEKNAVSQALRRLMMQGLVTRDGSKWQLVGADEFFD